VHDKKRQAIIKGLVKIIDNTALPGTVGERRTQHISIDGASFNLIDDTVDEYESLINELLIRLGWAEKWSEKYVDKALQSIIADTLVNNAINKVEQLFNKLVSDFDNYAQEQVVYLPLFWIQLEAPVLKLGNVALEKITQSKLEDIIAVSDFVFNQSTSPAETIEFVKEKNREALQGFLGKVCTRYEVNAEPIRAKQRAEEETRRVVDLLRYSIPALHSKDLRVCVGIEGDVPFRFFRPSPIFLADGTAFSLTLDSVGPLSPLRIDQDSLHKMEKIGVFIASEILQKDSLAITEYEESILRGIHWLANATVQTEKENAFLSLIISIENYLTPRDNNPIGTAIAEGVAITLASGFENRKRIKTKIKEYYSNRSGISHGGKKTILDRDLDELTEITGRLTMWMIQHRDQFSTIPQLLEWIEAQKLG
jgi:hypothetical protein